MMFILIVRFVVISTTVTMIEDGNNDGDNDADVDDADNGDADDDKEDGINDEDDDEKPVQGGGQAGPLRGTKTD